MTQIPELLALQTASDLVSWTFPAAGIGFFQRPRCESAPRNCIQCARDESCQWQGDPAFTVHLGELTRWTAEPGQQLPMQQSFKGNSSCCSRLRDGPATLPVAPPERVHDNGTQHFRGEGRDVE